MPLETATYISQLVSTNPVHTDGLNQADSHMRLLKAVLQAQFPNFTAAALTSTNANIDAAVAAAVTTGVAVLADAGAFFKTNTTDGFTNPAAGEVDVKATGSIVAKFKADLSVTVMGALSGASISTAGAYSGGTGQLVPIGATMIWWADTLPTGYLWCNGQAINRTTYAALWALFGTFYGAGDGVTTFNLPDLRENVPVGKGTMGATAAPGRITNFVTNTLGSLWGECLHLLGIGEVPAHSHTATVTDAGHTHQLHVNNGIVNGSSPSVIAPTTNSIAAGNPNLLGTTDSATTGITVANANTGGGTTHNNVQPSIVCNWIIKY